MITTETVEPAPAGEPWGPRLWVALAIVALIGTSLLSYGIGTWLLFGVPYYAFALIYALYFAGRVRKDDELSLPERLESRGCLSVGSAIELRRILRDAVPSRPGQDLYPSYGYRPGGLGLDLRPGVRLKVQRAHFEGSGRTVKDLIGTSTAYYEFQGLRFSRPVVELSSGKLQGVKLDVTLNAPPQPIYRLYFLTSFLKRGLRRSALLLGAGSVSRLQELERRITANPAVGCEELDSAACISFEGEVSVSAQISVIVNGAAMWVDWGTYVGTLLPQHKAEAALDVRLRRKFQGNLVPVGAENAGELRRTALVAGDEVTYRQ